MGRKVIRGSSQIEPKKKKKENEACVVETGLLWKNSSFGEKRRSQKI